jgi:hypothetical protein
MSDPAPPFWKTTPLRDMSASQWESLCDGCAKCCLIKYEDEDTGEWGYTRLHCKLLDATTCRCSDYADRQRTVPECTRLTPDNVLSFDWLPETCGYVRVAKGQDLPDWHPLVCGDPDRIHREGHSVMGRTINEDTVLGEEDQLDWIVDWQGNPP